jgi:hypothetical protein
MNSQRTADLVLLVGSGLIVLASVLLTPDPVHLSLFGWQLPPLCLIKAVTGTTARAAG